MKTHRFFLNIPLLVLFFASAAEFASPGQLGLPTGQGQDELSYQMPAGWVAQALQGGPELKAHYVLMGGGRPYAEMYQSQSAAPAGQSLEQIFEQALAAIRPQLPYYQARGTQMTTIAGMPAVVHEFSHMPSGAGVIFIARTFTFISGSSVYTFFFQSTESYFPSTQGYFSQVMANVRLIPKPAPAPVNPVNQGGVFPAGQPLVAAGGSGIVADEMGLNFDLPAGWRKSDDAAGAKYRFYGTGGGVTASLFIFKPSETDGITTLLGGTEESTLDVALRTRVDQEYKSFQQYAPIATVKRQIGGYRGLVHDFTFSLNDRPVFYRWVAFVVPRKGDDPSIRIAPMIPSFAFLAMEANQVTEMQRQWDAIMNSMRMKGAPAFPVGPTPADRGNLAAPPPRPKAEGGLPDLVADEPEAGFYAEPFGRYKIVLPPGAVRLAVRGEVASFRMPGPKTTIFIHSYEQEETGLRERNRIAEGRKLNGVPSTINVGGREATIALYTSRDADGENMVWVVAPYSKSGLLITISLPAKDYPAAKDWISALLKGVRF